MSLNLYKQIAPFEGVVNHLYKDSEGFITVGCGFLLKDLAAAQSLAWDRPGQVANDWAILKTLDKGMGVPYYRSRMLARLPELVISREFDRRMDIFEVQVMRDWKGLHSAPEPVQRAVMDLAYNLGGGFLPKWPKLREALATRDWKRAADECRRPQVQDARNEATRKLFLSAV